MEQWEKNYYISAIAGANNGSSLVVMSRGKGKIVIYIFFKVIIVCIYVCVCK